MRLEDVLCAVDALLLVEVQPDLLQQRVAEDGNWHALIALEKPDEVVEDLLS